jgi:uncharacterized protein (DUF1800 family)
MKLTSFAPIYRSSLGLFVLSLAAFFIAAFTVSAGKNDTPKILTPEQRLNHVVSRLSFGARPGDLEKIKVSGIKAYIDEQLDPGSIDDSALDQKLAKLPTLALSTPTLAEQYNPPKPAATPTPTPGASPSPTPSPAPTATPGASPSPSPAPTMAPVIGETMTMITPAPGASPTPAIKPSPTPVPKNPGMVVSELQCAKLLRAVYSNRQLYEMTVDFWENHFSINGNRDALRLLMTSFDRDAVRPFALGRFRDLLGAVAHSPAMLFYLDNWQSSLLKKYPATKDKPERQTGGINENYARELMELHTLGVDGGYTQKDVQEVARCFTGWTIRKPNEEGLFIYNPAMHDNGEKIVLGQKIPAGGGIADGERVLDILAKQPATAHFIARKLARRFYGDDPPKAVIEDAAQTFLRTDGSIRETLRSLITAPAFFNPATYQAKVRSPFEFVAAALRITDAETDGNRPVLDWIGKMGEPVFGRVTPDGFPDQNSEWLSNNDLLMRFNFAAALAANKIKGTRIEALKLLEDSGGGAGENDRAQIAEKLSALILTDRESAHTRSVLDKIAAGFAPGEANKNTPGAAIPANVLPDNYVAQMITLMLGAPEFQRK